MGKRTEVNFISWFHFRTQGKVGQFRMVEKTCNKTMRVIVSIFTVNMFILTIEYQLPATRIILLTLLECTLH